MNGNMGSYNSHLVYIFSVFFFLLLLSSGNMLANLSMTFLYGE